MIGFTYSCCFTLNKSKYIFELYLLCEAFWQLICSVCDLLNQRASYFTLELRFQNSEELECLSCVVQIMFHVVQLFVQIEILK